MEELNTNVKQSFDEEFNLPVQKKFLSVMIHDKQWTLLNGLEVIKPEYFENHYLQHICKEICAYCKKHTAIPPR